MYYYKGGKNEIICCGICLPLLLGVVLRPCDQDFVESQWKMQTMDNQYLNHIQI